MVPMVSAVVVTDGGANRVSIVPPNCVLVPTASQFAALAHDTPSRLPTPDGTLWATQLCPAFTVSRMLAPPTAVHVEDSEQLTATRGVAPAGAPRSFHCVPPSVVPITWDPVARQDVSVEQE